MMKLNDVTQYRIDQRVALITLDNPPVNTLSAQVRSGLAQGIAVAEGDDAVAAVVILCAGRTFFAGADITEFGKLPASPTLGEICALLESATKPTVAAIHGTALGGGLEVALAAHFRVALSSARLGLPEVKLGLMPGAGGTQRLPRLVGVEKALEMIVSGDPIGAPEAARCGLVNAVFADGDLAEAALAFAQNILSQGLSVIPVRDRTETLAGVMSASSIFAEFRKSTVRKSRGLEAPELCIEAVEGAVSLPFDEGLALERRLFQRLLVGPQSAALRHLFFAERQATRPPGDRPEGNPREVRTVGVVGAGTMGAGIAMVFLDAGLPVTIVETKQAALDRGLAGIRRTYETAASKGRLSAEGLTRKLGLLTASLSLDDLGDADLVIEAVFEDQEVKRALFARLDAIVRPGAILATNTSFLDVAAIAGATRRPQDVVGLHFFSPANVMKLVEIVRTDDTGGDVLETAMRLAKTIGKVGVHVGNGYGFVGNRMLAARGREADRLIVEGALPQDVDRVAVAFGFAMGPFQTRDLVGLDVGWNAAASASASIRDMLNEQGRHGQKTGAGYYDYDDARRPTPSSVTAAIVDAFSVRESVVRRSIDDREILDRILFAMVNEGARILEEGIAARSSDIDVIWAFGYGWPRHRGGPMFWADQQGLPQVLARLEKLVVHGDEFVPASLIRRLAAENATFSSF